MIKEKLARLISMTKDKFAILVSVIKGKLARLTSIAKEKFEVWIPIVKDQLERFASMIKGQFVKLVQNLRYTSLEKPNQARFRVLMLVLLGFGYIFLPIVLFLVLIGFTAVLIWNEGFSVSSSLLALITISMPFLLLRALFAQVPMPSGVSITSQDAPKLFEMIDQLQLRMKTPQVDTVLVDSEFRVAVLQVPRFGLLGRKKNVLIIGLPLLHSVSVEQFQAVLARELGQIPSRAYWFDRWVNHLRRTWEHWAVSQIENKPFGTVFFQWFFKWYVPIFNTYTSKLDRQQEYMTDMTSPQMLGEAWIRVHMTRAYYEEEFLSTLSEHARKAEGILSISSFFAKQVKQWEIKKRTHYFQQVLQAKINSAHSSPNLAEHLQSLGVEAKFPTPLNNTAADHFLADASEWIQGFERYWIEQIDGKWEPEVRTTPAVDQSIEAQQTEEKELAEQEVKQSDVETQEDSSKTLQDHWEAAKHTYEVEGAEAAIPLYEEIIHKFGANEETSLAFEVIGEAYLNQGDPRGVSYIEKAMELDWKYRQEGLALLEQFYQETNEQFALKRTRDRAVEWKETLEEFAEEMEDIFEDDHWVEHDLAQTLLESMITECSKIPAIEEIYVVRKISKTIPEAKHYLFGFLLNIPDDIDTDDYEERFGHLAVKRIPKEISSSVIILNDDELFTHKIQQVSNSLLYKRSRERITM